MKKIIRLTESDLRRLVERVLLEADDARMNNIVGTICNTKFGIIQSGANKGKSFCDYYVKTYSITKEELEEAQGLIYDKCPNVLTTPEIPANKKDPNWEKIYKFFRDGKDGSKLNHGVRQPVCNSDYYYFDASSPEFNRLTIFSDGDCYVYKTANSRGLLTKWGWENDKPVFNLPQTTKKASGYANTEDDILTGNKILGIGSRGDLVKRIQFMILKDTGGKTNPGCKKDADGKYSANLCDGIFGPKTKAAVREFQKKEALRDKSGLVGTETWSFMNPDSDMEYAVTID